MWDIDISPPYLKFFLPPLFSRTQSGKKCRRVVTASGFSVFIMWSGLFTMAWGECRLEKDSGEESGVMVRRVVGSCTSEERLTLAIKGEDVRQALQAGRGIELEGVVLTGDVMLDQLPVEEVSQEDLAFPLVGKRLVSGHIEEVRRIRGPLILRHVEVQGVIATNFVTGGYLLVEGPVSIQKSTVHQSIDFSRAAFLDGVDFSGSNILHEGFFIQSVFAKGANFEAVKFGTHTRFHKAIFGEKATFSGSTFQGVAEFLEVTYHQEAVFSNAHFTMGTGFSGTRFQQSATFNDAIFGREAYFRFVEFAGDARFQGVTFGAATDFTEAKFHATWDFSHADFAVLPDFPKAQADVLAESENRFLDAKVQAGLFAFLLGVLLVFILRVRRSHRPKPEKS